MHMSDARWRWVSDELEKEAAANGVARLYVPGLGVIAGIVVPE